MSKLAVAALAIVLAAAIILAVQSWTALADVEMDTAGWVALVLGGVATLALALGLVMLMQFSHRRGYDDRAGADAAPARGTDEDAAP